MKKFFGILGGMGTLATTNFLVEMNKRHFPENDQDYFNYILMNHADIPDRTEYILDPTKPNPVEAVIEDVHMLNLLKPEFIIMPCNTIHYFFDDIQKETDIPILNMIDLTVDYIAERYQGAKKVGLFATEGTHQSRIYENRLVEKGYQVVLPDRALQDKINKMIYYYIKERSHLFFPLYYEILEDFKNCGADIVLLGCTEVSLMNSEDEEQRYPIVDAEKVLLDKTIALAKELKA